MNNTSASVARIHAALGKPVYQRCAELSRLLGELSTKELHTVLPLIVENIFGFNNQPGWGLGTIRAQYHQDFSDIRGLLKPSGVLLSAIYKLSADPYLRYDFPVACLPLVTQKVLEGGNVPAFYSDKIQLNAAGRPHTLLSLNAFEYYFFHFTYYIIGPALSRTSGWTNPAESLYPVLLEDCLQYFLPVTGQPAPLNVPSAGVKTAISHHYSPVHTPHRSSPTLRSPTRSPFTGLLRVHRHSPTLNTPLTGATSVNENTDHGAWRSTAFLQIVVEFWLNHVDSGESQISLQTHHYRRGAFAGGFRSVRGEDQSPFQYLLFESFLPGLDHVRLVRMLVKHLHKFSNSAKSTAIQTQNHANATWDDFKRSVIPQFVQKKLYTFIKHSFEHWPLDSSFRLILETWLSYIQPWRYTTDAGANAGQREQEASVSKVDRMWKPFIVENLLFYCVPLQSFLHRCLRVDLSVPKNAYMLFRATKVFSLPDLREYLMDAEYSLTEPSIHPSFHASNDIGASYLGNPGRHGSLPGMLTMHFTELEGPMFQYTPLYSEGTLRMVCELVRLIYEAREMASDSSRKSQEGDKSFLAWLGLSGSADLNTSRLFSQEVDEFGERGGEKRIIPHLDNSASNLCHIFQIEVSDRPADKSVSWGSNQCKSQAPETLAPDVYDTDDGPQLSPLGRYQLANGLRKFHIDYDGDPDLQPIRSFESALLVRMFYALSSYLNQKYHSEMQTYYHNPGFKGRFARQFLSAPFSKSSTRDRHPSSPDKMPPLSPKSQRLRDLDARLSLRWLGSYQNAGYLMAGYLLMYLWWGTGPVGYLFVILTVTVMYVLLMALVRPKGKKA